MKFSVKAVSDSVSLFELSFFLKQCQLKNVVSPGFVESSSEHIIKCADGFEEKNTKGHIFSRK